MYSQGEMVDGISTHGMGREVKNWDRVKVGLKQFLTFPLLLQTILYVQKNGIQKRGARGHRRKVAR